MNLSQALSHAVRSPDDLEGRYYGIVSGVVTNANDSAGLGRVKARLRGMETNAETGWLAPLWPGGIEGVPHKDDPVLVMFEDGNENRGAYLWFPSSKTKDRPSEAMVLGLTFAGMYNDLVTQFNQLRSDMASHTHSIPSLTCSAPGTTTASTTGAKATSATSTGKMQKADGSTVAASSGDKVALSGRVKVGA